MYLCLKIEKAFFFKYITIILRYKHLLRKTENTYYKCKMFGLSIWPGIKSQNFWHFDIQIAKSLHFLNLTPWWRLISSLSLCFKLCNTTMPWGESQFWFTFNTVVYFALFFVVWYMWVSWQKVCGILVFTCISLTTHLS